MHNMLSWNLCKVR